jgi:hypothetical protein
VLLFASCAAAGQTDTPKKATDEHIAKLIQQLGSDDFNVREQASRQLAELEEALPALRQARESKDAEVRRAAATLIAQLEARAEERFIREAVARVNDQGLDLFLDRMVLKKDFATEANWKVLVELAKALARRTAQTGATPPKILEQDFLRLKEIADSAAKDYSGARVRVDGISDSLNAVHGSLLVSSGSLESINSTDRSILFVNGDIKSLNSTTDSIIICTGTIKNFNYTKGCIIICNGVIEYMNCTESNALFVRGELRSLNSTQGNVIEATRLGRCTVSERNTYLNGKAPEDRAGEGDRFVKADSTPLGLFRFFEPGRAGLSFTMVEGDAQAEKVLANTPFAQAGLRKGDRVLAVDREKFLTEDLFVRLLRRRVATGKALFKVQRTDRILEIAVSFE